MVGFGSCETLKQKELKQWTCVADAGCHNSGWAVEHHYQRWEVEREVELDHQRKVWRQEDNGKGEHEWRREDAENWL